jgi:hypothetical protein
MRPRTLSACLLIAGCLSAGCAWLVTPAPAADLGLDVWAVPGLRQELARAEARREELGRLDGEAKHSLALKSALTAELIAGRTTLREVAGLFRDLNAGRPECTAVVRTRFPGRTEAERYGRNVIAHVESVLDEAPALRAEVVTRLEAELREWPELGGGSASPGWSAGAEI